MKLHTAFKLSTIALALASTSAFASTLDVAALSPEWESARDVAPATADRTAGGNNISFYDENGSLKGTLPGLNYQYTDVGSSGINGNTVEEIKVTNQLTELYRNGSKDQFLVKISPLGSDSANQGVTYTFDDTLLKTDLKAYVSSLTNEDKTAKYDISGDDWLKQIDAKDIAKFFESTTDKYSIKPLEQINADASISQQINPEMVFLAGLTKNQTAKAADLLDIRRLDSSYLEYAHESKLFISSTDLGGNLTNDDKEQSLVLANTEESKRPDITLEKTSAGVINGILNNKNSSTDREIDVDLDKRVYGLNVHNSYEQYDAKGEELISSSKDYAQVEAGKIVVASTKQENDVKTENSTVITSTGITTDSLTVGGVNVGQTLSNVAKLGTLTSEQFDAVVNSGASISALDTRVTAVETSVTKLDTKLTDEVSRLDGRIDAELAANADASTAYTNEKAAETLNLAKEEDAKTLDLAKAEDAKTLDLAKAEDVQTLAEANAYTDDSVKASTAGLLTSAKDYTDSRVNQLNKRVDDVEKTAYRGVAIALAAQQNVPNIKPGQYAVFGGVGHYESESAFAFGLVGAINERTSISGAVGVAGGSEVGGRVGVAYVFGGK